MTADHPSGPEHDGDRDGGLDGEFAAHLAPFVAWLATQQIDERTRRRHRRGVEQFLLWSRSDQGPVKGRRHRYERHVSQDDPERLDQVHSGLDRWSEYRAIVACTLPIEQ